MKRIRKRDLETNKFRIPPRADGYRRRAPYFQRFRAERRALSLLENTFSKIDNRVTYRANRYLYYAVVPHLAKYLWFEPDRARLQFVEIDLFNELLSWSFRRGRHRIPDRVPIWSIRSHMSIKDGQKQQKL
jgi:hypothetical protein